MVVERNPHKLIKELKNLLRSEIYITNKCMEDEVKKTDYAHAMMYKSSLMTYKFILDEIGYFEEYGRMR